MEQESQELRARLQEEHRRAQTDPLTGLFNRLGYEETARRLMERWHERGGPFSVVVMDVDRFKYLNDRYGHQAGDKALQTIGTLLSDLLPGAAYPLINLMAMEIAWAALQPLALMVVFTVALGRLAGLDGGGTSYAAFS